MFEIESPLDLKTPVRDYLVSTVELQGAFGPKEFETMVFRVIRGEIDYMDLFCQRYSTREEAMAEHGLVVFDLGLGILPLRDDRGEYIDGEIVQNELEA